MSTGQRIIKSLAVAFGLFLTFTIFFSIVGGLYAFTSMFSKDNVIEENTSILLNQSTENIKYLDIDVNSSNLVIKPGNSFIIETNNKHINHQSFLILFVHSFPFRYISPTILFSRLCYFVS